MRTLLLPVALLLAPYFYFILKRLLCTLGTRMECHLRRFLLLGASLALTLCGMLLSWTSAVLLLHLAAFAGVVQLINFILKKSARQKYENGFAVWKRLYGLLIIPLLLSVGMTVYGYVNLHTVQMTSYTVRTDKDVRATGYRVALIADVHFGVSLDEAALLEKCAEIAAQAPDLVVLCGDIVDHSTTREGMQSVFRALGAIESTYGVYYVYGNHDRPSRMMQGPFSAEELNAAIEESGITILQDECVQITDDLVLVGREDRSKGRGDTPRASIEALLADVERTDFILTLDHQPNEYAENTAAGTDLLLSGHTHGGQLFPLDILQELVPFNDAVYGEYALGEDGTAIVTSGFGTWEIPIKTAAPAEYVIIDILPE
jgi:predicted MPP superfamily phosphohydrolase